jgi:hemolysin III
MPEFFRRLHFVERCNALTHFTGLLAALVGAVVLVGMAAQSPHPLEVPSTVVYSASLVLVYLSSTLYHGASHAPTKDRLQVLDHCAIYLLIAGTYTPLLLVSVGGDLGWSFFVLVWAMAAAGIVFKLFFTGRFWALSTASYLAMGWIAVLAAEPLLAALPPRTVAWIVAGGLAYTVGSLVFLMSHRWAHPLWHLFVMAGSACHFVAIVSRIPQA